MRSHFIKEIIYRRSYCMSQIKFFTICDHRSILYYLVKLFINILDKILGSSFQQKNLIIVITMVGKVTTFLTHQLIMNYAKCYVWLQMIWTNVLLTLIAFCIIGLLLYYLILLTTVFIWILIYLVCSILLLCFFGLLFVWAHNTRFTLIQDP